MKYLLVITLLFSTAFATYDDKGTDYSNSNVEHSIDGDLNIGYISIFFSMLNAVDYSHINKGVQKNISTTVEFYNQAYTDKLIYTYEITRSNNDSDMIVKLWISAEDSNTSMKARIISEPTKLNPYGEVEIDIYTIKKDRPDDPIKGKIQSRILNGKNTLSLVIANDKGRQQTYIERLSNNDLYYVNFNTDDSDKEYKSIYYDNDDEKIYEKSKEYSSEYPNGIDDYLSIRDVSGNPTLNVVHVNLYDENGSHLIANSNTSISCQIDSFDNNVTEDYFTSGDKLRYSIYNDSDNTNKLDFDYSDVNNTIQCSINDEIKNVFVKVTQREYVYPSNDNVSSIDNLLDAKDESLYININEDDIKAIGPKPQ